MKKNSNSKLQNPRAELALARLLASGRWRWWPVTVIRDNARTMRREYWQDGRLVESQPAGWFDAEAWRNWALPGFGFFWPRMKHGMNTD